MGFSSSFPVRRAMDRAGGRCACRKVVGAQQEGRRRWLGTAGRSWCPRVPPSHRRDFTIHRLRPADFSPQKWKSWGKRASAGRAAALLRSACQPGRRRVLADPGAAREADFGPARSASWCAGAEPSPELFSMLTPSPARRRRGNRAHQSRDYGRDGVQPRLSACCARSRCAGMRSEAAGTRPNPVCVRGAEKDRAFMRALHLEIAFSVAPRLNQMRENWAGVIKAVWFPILAALGSRSAARLW